MYRACTGEEVHLSGGRELDPAAFRPVSDPAILQRLPENARSKVVAVDLKAQGISNFGQMRRRGFYHPYVNPGLELFFNDQPMQLARWPNQGMVRIGKVLDTGSKPREGDFSNRGGKFTYDYDRPAAGNRPTTSGCRVFSVGNLPKIPSRFGRSTRRKKPSRWPTPTSMASNPMWCGRSTMR